MENETEPCWVCDTGRVRSTGKPIAYCLCPDCCAREGRLPCEQRRLVVDARPEERRAVWERLVSRWNAPRNAEALPTCPGIPPRYAKAEPGAGARSWARSGSTVLTLTGPTGTGKTHAACAALRLLAHQTRNPGSVVMIKAADLPSLSPEQRAELRRLHAVALDDLGQRSSPACWEAALALVDARMDANRRTIITTNATLEAIAQASPALASRLASGHVQALHGRDRRLPRQEQASRAQGIQS